METTTPNDPLGTLIVPTRIRGPLGNYFFTLKSLLTRPSEFFKNLSLPVNPVFALAFGLITHWIGSALEYLWTVSFARTLSLETGQWREIFRKLVDQVDSTDRVQALNEIQARAMHWVMGAGAVMIDPFKSCLKILAESLVLWMAARIFVPRMGADAEEVLSYRTTLAIVCFSMAPAILAGIPVVGSIIPMIFSSILMIIGAREVYRVRTGRATLIVLFPQLVVLAIVVFLFAVFSVAIIKLFFNFVGT